MIDYENQTITESMKTCLDVNFGLTDSDIWLTLKQHVRSTTDKNLNDIKEKIIEEIENMIENKFPLDDRIIELFDEIEKNEVNKSCEFCETVLASTEETGIKCPECGREY